ncbi:HAL/PAL/TAL family ammonia-lyase [Paenibacillus paeoniae]|uniref:Aromatic amino acid lyase n=1 Tax=Paenibacillus paeoniae TaxID=2292705 RepID=A0A371PIR8_9BACL|nr:aromatic amino acid ammonia-lyase [Paenibacillus paeoniae]REK76033.1 aromatic amino acid lyase [Paenibacillus paeoniae]
MEHSNKSGTDDLIDRDRRIVVLDGSRLTLEAVERVAKENYRVEIAEEAVKRVERGYELLGELAGQGIPIYGLNRGVGLNKDQEVSATEQETFNRNLIYSHAAGVGPYASDIQSRAIVLVRLNTMLVGSSGVQVAIPCLYKDMLNAGIAPLLPLSGSVGAADIAILSHIGLAVLGEGDVSVNGHRVVAAQALMDAGLAPVKLTRKDALAIVSSNALSIGTGALALGELRRLLRSADAVLALSLEAIEGTISPLDEAAHRLMPFDGAAASAAFVRQCLQGGTLVHASPLQCKLQDPLSFRSACHVHGAARDAISYAERLLHIHMNGAEDNPCLVLDEGRLVASSNFDITSWTVAMEMVGIAMSHVSKVTSHRSLRLGSPVFTGLNRFLSPGAGTIAFGTMQKTIASLDAEIRGLSQPVSADYLPLAGDMEDHANQTPLVVRKIGDMIDRLYYLLGMEAMHAAQAIDLRGTQEALGSGTALIYQSIRSVIPMLKADRPLTPDIEAAAARIRAGFVLSGHGS